MRWLVQPNPNPETVQSLAKALTVPVVIAQLLVQRGHYQF
jgi:predicted LPLAT superfamily acyltransferase